MKQTNIYVLDCGDQIKVGRTIDVQTRIKAIETGSGRHIKQHFSISAHPDYEKLLHEKLADYRGLGEYFSYPYENAVALLQELINENLVEKALLAKEKERLEEERVRLEKQAIRLEKQRDIAKKTGISDKIKALMKLRGKNKNNKGLAKYLGISNQSLSNKFYRDSYSGEDLIKIAKYLDCELAFVTGTTKIILDEDDIKNTKETGEKI